MPASGDHRSALIAGYLGWTLDAFDFFLVIMCLTAIGREFGESDARMAVAIWLTLAFRPLGAFLFGLLADRYGRRLPLMLDLVFYSVIEVLTGFAPSFPVFLILRALFGVAETGSVWITAAQFGVSALGFLSQHLVVLLDPALVVGNLHDAYRQRAQFDADYGVLMTGPSATADIEGVLIHGAQGIRGLTVVLVA